MPRSQRLLDLVQVLRRHRRPVSGAALAEEVGVSLRRIIWPFALAFFDRARVVVAWCELRGDYRSFRTDRIAALKPTAKRYPRRRLALLKEWRTRENIREQ
jgi:predicted DNA-binding transcriptional regulator YafY